MRIESLPESLVSHEGSLYRAVRTGLQRFKDECATQRLRWTLRSERSVISDFIVAEVRAAGFEVLQIGNLRLVKIGDYRIKIKKLDASMHTRNQYTRLLFDFLNQQLFQASLFDAETECLHLGYIPDAVDVANSAVWMTKPDGNRRPEWVYEMTDKSAADLSKLPQTQPDEKPSAPRFRAKRDEKAKKRKGEG